MGIMKNPAINEIETLRKQLEYGTFYCTTCRARAQLKIIGEYSYQQKSDSPEELHIVFGSCVACLQPGLVSKLQVWDNEYVHQTQFYPPFLSREMFHFRVPDLVKESYAEAEKCASIDAWLATVVMIRRALEAVVRDFDSKSKNVHTGLQKMKDKGAISDELLMWGNELRLIGNSGAHATESQISAQDAREALDFAAAIIETIYHLRPKFEALRARRQKATKKPPQGDIESDDES